MKKIIILGSTGSVGRKALEIVAERRDSFELIALGAGGNNRALLAEQANAFKPRYVCAADRDIRFRQSLSEGIEFLAGEEAMCDIAGMKEADLVFIAIAGTAALKPLLAALDAGKTVALASKEPLVSAGALINAARCRTGAAIIPVDSEHSALYDCLRGLNANDVRKLYITGSGGSLHEKSRDEFCSMKVEDVLRHPKWDMGRKITVDSATLMNKALEMIEAKWLFDIPLDRIELVIHPEAVVHAIVELSDGTQRALFFQPDMRYPIARALWWPDIPSNRAPGVDIAALGNMTFMPPDRDRFPALEVAMGAMRSGGTAPAVLNASNEEAVGLFLKGKIPLTDIVKEVRRTLGRHDPKRDPELDQIIKAECWAKEEVRRSCSCG